MANGYQTMQAWILHYERQLPRRENYRKKSVAHLEKLEKKLAHYVEITQGLLDRGPGFDDDQTAIAMRDMYEYHRKAALLAIAAKKQRAA